MANFKLIKFRSEIGEVIKDVEYVYSIEDSSGLLKMKLTMYNDIEEVEYFINQLYNLYKIEHFTCFYHNYKYLYDKGNIVKIKMY